MEALAAIGRAAFKFVVPSVADLDEITVLERTFGLAPIWVMPEARSSEDVIKGCGTSVTRWSAEGGTYLAASRSLSRIMSVAGDKPAPDGQEALVLATEVACDVSWGGLEEIVSETTGLVQDDDRPDILVGVSRGGLVPAVLMSHRLGVRHVRLVDVARTLSDEIGAEKQSPVVWSAGALGDVAGRDVLVVDDVAGTGVTITTVMGLVGSAGAGRVRTAVCAVNEANWAQDQAPDRLLTYTGLRVRGWVRFPWERG